MGEVMTNERKKKVPEPIKEDVPANAMGLSSSDPLTGPVDTFDPLLGSRKKLRKKLIMSLFKRKPPKI